MTTHSEPEKVPLLDTRPVIVCFGDSLTAGYGLEYEDSYPADLQGLLDGLGLSPDVEQLTDRSVEAMTAQILPDVLKLEGGVVKG